MRTQSKINVKTAVLVLSILLLVVLFLVSAHVKAAPAPREVLIIGTPSPGTFFYDGGVAIVKLLMTHADIKGSVFPQSGEGAWLEVLNRGNCDLGLAQGVAFNKAVRGEAPFSKKYPIRLVQETTVYDYPWVTGIKTDIKTRADIKGRRVAAGFTANPQMKVITDAMLANAGLTEKDINPVIVAGYPEAVRAMMGGRAEIMASAFGPTGLNRQFKAKIGARIIPIDPSPEAMARTREVVPDFDMLMITADDVARAKWLEGDPNVEVSYPHPRLASPCYLVARTDLTEDVVYQISKVLWENYKDLATINPLFTRDWKPENMCTVNFSVPYHPGAIKWFKEKGVWTAQHEKLNSKLLEELGEKK